MDGPDGNNFIDEGLAEDLPQLGEAIVGESVCRNDQRDRTVAPTGDTLTSGAQDESPRNLSFSQICAKQQHALQTLKKGSLPVRHVRSLAHMLPRQFSEPPPSAAHFFGARSITEGSQCSDAGSDFLPEGDSAISIIRSVSRQHSRAHDSCLVALTELKRNADTHYKELNRVLTQQGQEIEVLRRRRSFLNRAGGFIAIIGLGLGLAHGLHAGPSPLFPHKSMSHRRTPSMWR